MPLGAGTGRTAVVGAASLAASTVKDVQTGAFSAPVGLEVSHKCEKPIAPVRNSGGKCSLSPVNRHSSSTILVCCQEFRIVRDKRRFSSAKQKSQQQTSFAVGARGIVPATPFVVGNSESPVGQTPLFSAKLKFPATNVVCCRQAADCARIIFVCRRVHSELPGTNAVSPRQSKNPSNKRHLLSASADCARQFSFVVGNPELSGTNAVCVRQNKNPSNKRRLLSATADCPRQFSFVAVNPELSRTNAVSPRQKQRSQQQTSFAVGNRGLSPTISVCRRQPRIVRDKRRLCSAKQKFQKQIPFEVSERRLCPTIFVCRQQPRIVRDKRCQHFAAIYRWTKFHRSSRVTQPNLPSSQSWVRWKTLLSTVPEDPFGALTPRIAASVGAISFGAIYCGYSPAITPGP